MREDGIKTPRYVGLQFSSLVYTELSNFPVSLALPNDLQTRRPMQGQ